MIKPPATIFHQTVLALEDVLEARTEVDDWSSVLDEIQQRQPYSNGQPSLTAELLASVGYVPRSEDLGFVLGLRIPATAHGDVGMGVRVAPTLREAIRLVADFHQLIVPLIHLSYRDTESGGQLKIAFRQPLHRRSEAVIVATVASMLHQEIRLAGVVGRGAVRFELTPSSKGMESRYRKHLRAAPIMTDAICNLVHFNHGLLDTVNPTADLHTFLKIRTDAELVAKKQGELVALPDSVRELVMAHVGDPPAMPEMARLMGLSTRRLRQALAKEHTNYQLIVRECRIEYACALLKNAALPIVQVASRLGYSDPAIFSHAFHRWTGRSPTAFRNELFSRSDADVEM